MFAYNIVQTIFLKDKFDPPYLLTNNNLTNRLSLSWKSVNRPEVNPRAKFRVSLSAFRAFFLILFKSLPVFFSSIISFKFKYFSNFVYFIGHYSLIIPHYLLHQTKSAFEIFLLITYDCIAVPKMSAFWNCTQRAQLGGA